MRRVAVTIALATSWVAFGCEQKADVVAYASAPLDTGGAGGNGGSGGVAGSAGMDSNSGGASGGVGGTEAVSSGGAGAMASGGTGGGSDMQDAPCDAATLLAYGRFQTVKFADCTFDPRDAQLGALLLRHIFTQPPVILDPEAAPPDIQCNMLSRPPDFFAWARPVNEGATLWLICPAFCAALVQWIEEQESALQECSPDAGI
jgi:hypothetical protein